MITSIHSERLELIPLLPPVLRAVLEQDFTEAERTLGLSVPDGFLESTDVMCLRLQQIEAEPTFQPWSLRAMVLRDHRMMVGHIGCHTAPAPEYLRSLAPGGVEFGFTVFPCFRRNGYAREASMSLMRWAHEDHGVTRFVLSIRPDNTASQNLAASLGFAHISSHIDEVDGLEDILERRLCNDAVASPCAAANS